MDAIEISVVIATYNRRDSLRRCLESLITQIMAPDQYEIVVVVDGSTDGTAEMLRSVAWPALHVIEQANAGPSAALNRGAGRARGRFCLFFDDDLLADQNLLAAHLRSQHARGGAVLLGNMDIALPPGADGMARYYADWWRQHYGRLALGREPSWVDCFSGNLSVPRTDFLRVGGFDVALRRLCDLELGFRLSRHGLPVAFVAGARAVQQYQKDAAAILADARAEGAAEALLLHRQPSMLTRLRVSRYWSAPPRVRWALRALLACHVPISWLARLSLLAQRTSYRAAWYRLLYDYALWSGTRGAVPGDDTWRRLISGVPILMYHAFIPDGQRAGRYMMPARRFAWQMRVLKWCGYRTLSLHEYLEHLRDCRLPPARSIVITIDDGYNDIRTVAYPILRRRRLHAVVFLVSERLGGSNDWDAEGELAGRPILSLQAVKELDGRTLSWGAHSRTHPALNGLSTDSARSEIAGSARDLETVLGHPVRTFAYPYGLADERIRSLVHEAGYLGAVGIRAGRNDMSISPHDLRRTEIYGTDSTVTFLLKLLFGIQPRRT